MVQNFDGIAVKKLVTGSHTYKYTLNKENLAKTAKNIYQKFSQRLTVFGNTPSNNTST